jgi:hypothetical protein
MKIKNFNKYLMISVSIFSILLISFFIIHNPARADITTGLVGWWKFDEGSGTTAADSSGNGNTGTLTNGPTWSTGKIGQALSFDSADDYVNAGTLGSFGSQRNNGFALSFWVKRNSAAASWLIGREENYDFLNALSIEINAGAWGNSVPGSVSFGLCSNEATLKCLQGSLNSNLIPLNTWTHLGVVIIPSTNTIQFYINGVLKTTTYDIQDTPAVFGNFLGGVPIGAISNSSSAFGFYNGLVDEVRIYNRALSAAEVLELYNYTGGGTPTPTPTPSGTPTPTPSPTPTPTPTPTPPPDTTPPTISSGSPSGTLSAGTTQTTMSVSTNENATCKYSTSAGTAYASMSLQFNSGQANTFHSTTITGLSNGNSYTRYVRCQDTAGNANTSDYTITFSVASSGGGTVNAASCSRADVQTAIDAAVDGDIVVIPVGNCTWSARGGSGAGSKNGIYINNKRIYIKGAGKNSTIITDGTTSSDGDAGLIYITGSKNFEISDFTITGHVYHGISAFVSARDWKIHDMKFAGKTNQKLTGIYIQGINNGTPYGVVYKCEFIDSKVDFYGRGDADWQSPSTFGTADAMYVEDCTFDRTADDSGLAVDSNNGARIVARYNTFDNTHIYAHVMGVAPRGARHWEVYDNIFRAHDFYVNLWIMLESGTGVVFNNKIYGIYWNTGVQFQYQRSCPGGGYVDYGSGHDWASHPVADGTYASDGQNSGYPGRDQLGTGQDTGVYPSSQIHDPTYIWNNLYSPTLNGSPNVIVGGNVYNKDVCARASQQTQINRDWYESQKPGYMPYTYPHPLRAEAADTTPPTAPSGVAVQ